MADGQAVEAIAEAAEAWNAIVESLSGMEIRTERDRVKLYRALNDEVNALTPGARRALLLDVAMNHLLAQGVIRVPADAARRAVRRRTKA